MHEDVIDSESNDKIDKIPSNAPQLQDSTGIPWDHQVWHRVGAGLVASLNQLCGLLICELIRINWAFVSKKINTYLKTNKGWSDDLGGKVLTLQV